MGQFIEITDFQNRKKAQAGMHLSPHPEIEGNEKHKLKATRKDFQLSRRLFHMTMGFMVATAYNVTLDHHQVVYLLGFFACLLYVLDQIRISYPKLAKKFESGTKYLLRAEEQLKESAAIPYAMAILLTIISFPKVIAVTSIYILAIADPLSAIIGIAFGKHHIVKDKSVEGSAAFFLSTFLAIIAVYFSHYGGEWKIWPIAGIVAILATAFEMLPIRLDDNLTIPLFCAFTLWITTASFGLF